ncbi:MAG: penicillin-binding protein 2 [Porticoccaceae bacterium]
MNNDYARKDPQREYRLFFGRLGFTVLIVLLMIGGLIWRYAHLQISRHADFVTRSENNRVLARAVPPPRGLIYDRNGLLLADNRPSVNLSVVVEQAEDLDTLFAELKLLIDITDDDIQRFQKQLKQRRRPYETVPLRFNLSDEEQGILAVNEHRLPGVQVTAQLLRYYPMGENLAHVLGYVGSINDKEIRELDPVRYSGTRVVGKTGLEKYYEDDLLGEVGYEKVEVNARGRVMRKLEHIEAVPGTDLHLYLDYHIQKTAMEALGDYRGAVVAIETATGGVLALASKPGFDTNLFVTGISHKHYQALLTSRDRPLFDRALQGQYPPGSTVKPIYALAALESKTISPEYTIYDPGYFQLKGEERKYRDWKKGGHGSSIDLHTAIVQSCDTLYYDIGNRMGIDLIAKYGAMFGLGEKSGIDMPSERAGIMPSRAWKRGARGIAWYPGDTINTSIGQGFTLATPLQLAVAVAGLATRGKMRVPRLVRPNAGYGSDNEEAGDDLSETTLDIKPANWRYVINAMEDVVHHRRGTAQAINRGLEYRIAGKTGTAQVIGIKQDEEYDAEKVAMMNRDHALFIAFAPADEPLIAVAVLVENGEHGSSTAAPIARKLMDAYMQNLPVTGVNHSEVDDNAG